MKFQSLTLNLYFHRRNESLVEREIFHPVVSKRFMDSNIKECKYNMPYHINIQIPVSNK